MAKQEVVDAVWAVAKALAKERGHSLDATDLDMLVHEALGQKNLSLIGIINYLDRTVTGEKVAKQQPTAPKYFLLSRSSLGEYGDGRGSSRKDVEELWANADMSDDLVVIRGVVMKPRIVIDEE